MHIKNLLEMVQVPETALREFMTFVCSDLFSRILYHLDTMESDVADEAAMAYYKLIRQYKTEYGQFKLYPDHTADRIMTGIIGFDKREIERRYYKDKKYPSKNMKIEFDIEITDNSSISGTYDNINRSTGKVTVHLPNDEKIKELALSPKRFDGFFNKVEGIVRHELMHGTQDMILPVDLQGETQKYYTDDDEIDYEKYYDSETEFQPLIYTYYKEFVEVIKNIETHWPDRADGKPKLSFNDMKVIFRTFVDPSAPKAYGIDYTREGFEHWFKTNKQKWKKAVSIAYRLFLKDYGNNS